MKKISGFSIINDTIGKKIAYTYSEVDDSGMVIKNNVRESFVVVNENILNSIKILEDEINSRLE